jgi:hypothetical protein
VSPTGNTATYDPQPITTAPDGSNGIAAAELSLGFGAGVFTGLVPGGAVAEQIGTRVGLEQGWIEPHPDLQLGIALGQIFGGLVRVVQGGLLIKGGAALSATGVGAIAGVPAIGVGAAWAVAGAANILAGIDGLSQALSTGSGSGAARGGANAAYEAAKAGGTHAGTLRNYAGRPLAHIERAIRGHERQVALHAEKLADPGKFAERWGQMGPREQAGLLNKWQSDMARNQELADVLRGLADSLK